MLSMIGTFLLRDNRYTRLQSRFTSTKETRLKSRVPAVPLGLQERENGLRSGIGLRQRSQRCLLEHLRLREVCRFSRNVGIADTRLRGGIVRYLRLRQVYRVVQLVDA